MNRETHLVNILNKYKDNVAIAKLEKKADHSSPSKKYFIFIYQIQTIFLLKKKKKNVVVKIRTEMYFSNEEL